MWCKPRKRGDQPRRGGKKAKRKKAKGKKTKEDAVKKVGPHVRALYSQPQSTVSAEKERKPIFILFLCSQFLFIFWIVLHIPTIYLYFI